MRWHAQSMSTKTCLAAANGATHSGPPSPSRGPSADGYTPPPSPPPAMAADGTAAVPTNIPRMGGTLRKNNGPSVRGLTVAGQHRDAMLDCIQPQADHSTLSLALARGSAALV